MHADHRRIDRLSVLMHRVGDVLGRLEATFDLQRTNTGFDQLRDVIDAGEILRRKQILIVACINAIPIRVEGVIQAASLGALPSVGRPAA